MSNAPQSDGYYDMTSKEVDSFMDISASATMKSDYLLSLHYNKKMTLGPENLQKVCELQALSQAFTIYLGKVFRNKTAALPDEALFRISIKSATAIAKMVFSIAEIQKELTFGGISLEHH